MASLKHFSSVFLIAIFMASHLAHARESQFFSKATKDTTTQRFPEKEQQLQQQETFTNSEQQATLTKVDEPNFIPETTKNGYGLYGHETGQLPPSATTTTTTVPEESLYSSYEQYKNNGGNGYYYSKDSYVTEDDNKGAQFSNRYTSTAALNDRKTFYSGGNSYGNVKRQGMSDTRFVENGKYFYDTANEEKYYPNYRYDKSSMNFQRSYDEPFAFSTYISSWNKCTPHINPGTGIQEQLHRGAVHITRT